MRVRSSATPVRPVRDPDDTRTPNRHTEWIRPQINPDRSGPDGRADLAFTPIDFLRRLATLIPPPFAHLTRYHGVFAPNHHLRAAIVPAGAIAATDSSRPASRRRLDWASLLKRVFATDVLVCDACGGAMRILAILPDGDASRAILEHLGLPTEPPPLGAVGPPGRMRDDAFA